MLFLDFEMRTLFGVNPPSQVSLVNCRRVKKKRPTKSERLKRDSSRKSVTFAAVLLFRPGKALGVELLNRIHRADERVKLYMSAILIPLSTFQVCLLLKKTSVDIQRPEDVSVLHGVPVSLQR